MTNEIMKFEELDLVSGGMYYEQDFENLERHRQEVEERERKEREAERKKQLQKERLAPGEGILRVFTNSMKKLKRI